MIARRAGTITTLGIQPQSRSRKLIRENTMGFFKKLSNIFAPHDRGDQYALWVYVRCKRCGEIVKARISLSNDLSAEYDDNQTTYVCRKMLVGEKRCFQPIEVVLKFDENRKLVDKVVTGGEFVSEQTLEESTKG
jgi:hypothetical protein